MMSASASATPQTTTRATARATARASDLVASEWIKFWSLRSTYLVLLTAVITGREPFSSQAPLKWLAAALRAQHEQGR